jgi:hypothetical protein
MYDSREEGKVLLRVDGFSESADSNFDIGSLRGDYIYYIEYSIFKEDLRIHALFQRCSFVVFSLARRWHSILRCRTFVCRKLRRASKLRNLRATLRAARI